MSRLLFDAFDALEVMGSIDEVLAGSSTEAVVAIEVQGTLDAVLAGSGLDAMASPGIEGSTDGTLAGSTSAAEAVVAALVPPRRLRGTKGIVRRRL